MKPYTRKTYFSGYLPNKHEMTCIVYLDSYIKTGTGLVDAYIDFRHMRDLDLFNRTINCNISTSTYIELHSLKTAKRLKCGCYYKLNMILLKGLYFKRDVDYGLFAGSFDLKNMQVPKGDFDEMLQTHDQLDNMELSMSYVPKGQDISVSSDYEMEVFVKDVGQANWNELRCNGQVKILYDAGAELHARKADVQSIFDSRKGDLEKSKPVLIISHWDMDHIHCLKYLDESDIKKCFSKLICVDKMKSVTSTSIFAQFKKGLGRDNVYCLPLPQRTDGVTMHHWKNLGCISIYRGESSRNINFCGIVMFVKGNTKTANYTGDCRLSQANDVYMAENEDKGKGHVLIDPHHGGDNGSVHRHYSTPCGEIIISVASNNSYGHPQKDMLRYLRSLGSVEQTCVSGDVSINI